MNDKLKEFANLDFERKKRTGVAEAVFCQGKTPVQVAEIMEELSHCEDNVIGTRATEEDYKATKELVPEAKFYECAKILAVVKNHVIKKEGIIAVITAGTSDIPVAEEAAITAELLGNKVNRIYDVGVAGLHRIISKVDQIRNASVVIVVAGMEGALASVVGGLVESPVVAVPTSIGYGANFGGLAALLSMLNGCAAGVGVVNIDNGYGAACLANKFNR